MRSHHPDQISVTGNNPTMAVTAMLPIIQKRSRRTGRSKRRRDVSRHPQHAMGTSKAAAARPNNCMMISATMAPGGPSRLRVGADVA